MIEASQQGPAVGLFQPSGTVFDTERRRALAETWLFRVSWER